MANTIGWANVMHLSFSTTEIYKVKEPKTSPAIAIFFIIYIIICSFFILNLFVGVVITTYSREKEKLGKNFMLTEDQKKWLDTKVLIMESKPKIFMTRPKE